MVTLAATGHISHIWQHWSHLVIPDHIWSLLVTYGHIGHIWSHLVTLALSGHIGPGHEVCTCGLWVEPDPPS